MRLVVVEVHDDDCKACKAATRTDRGDYGWFLECPFVLQPWKKDGNKPVEACRKAEVTG